MDNVYGEEQTGYGAILWSFTKHLILSLVAESD